MTLRLAEVFLPQLDELLSEFEALKGKAKYEDLSGGPTEGELVRFITRARAAVERIAPPNSSYISQAEELIQEKNHRGLVAVHLAGVLASLKADLEAGFLDEASRLIRGELFADFLEMAQHLAEEGYKDAAAVVAGSALEAHLRQLCQVSGIDVATEDGRQRKAESLNADLAKADVYSKLDQKSVTAWLGLRNDAAHGRYDRYGLEQVTLLVSCVRDFVIRNP